MSAVTTALPPQDLEGEEATLGAMIMSRKALELALAELVTEDFLRPAHQVVFSTIQAMHKAGEGVDERTLITWLQSKKQLVEAGGAAAVMSFAERVPAVSNAKAYIRGVKDTALLRGLLKAGNDIAVAALEADPAGARTDADAHPVRSALDEATGTLIELRSRVERRTFAKRSDIGDIVDAWALRYKDEQANADAHLAIPFPAHVPTLNNWTLGQRPGRLIVSSGGTGHGKSWFGLDCTDTVLSHKARVAYFSLELPQDEIAERLIAMGGVSYAQLQQREVEWDDMTDQVNRVGGDYQHLLTVLDGTTYYERIESEIVRARIEGRPYRYVVIDTVNQVELPGRASDETAEISKLYRRFKNLAIDHGLTVHAQAQLNRGWTSNRDPFDPPRLSDLKGGSSIEQNADLVLFVHRNPGAEEGTLSDMGKVVVAKGRNIRRRGQITVQFHPTGLRFKETANQGPGMSAGALRSAS